jgi:hypothetical protein
METSIWHALLYLVGILAFAGLNAAYLGYCERKGAARIQRRSGPTEVGYAGLLQPLADGIKLMSKQLLVPKGVDDIIFRLAPILAMIPAITSMAVIPFSENIQARAMELSVLLVFALASLAMFAILLGGWASGNKYALISSTRAVSQNAGLRNSHADHRHHRGPDLRVSEPAGHCHGSARGVSGIGTSSGLRMATFSPCGFHLSSFSYVRLPRQTALHLIWRKRRANWWRDS